MEQTRRKNIIRNARRGDKKKERKLLKLKVEQRNQLNKADKIKRVKVARYDNLIFFGVPLILYINISKVYM